jgi:CRP/FNR family transcriptional regulator, cyclic AMP receptor protein
MRLSILFPHQRSAQSWPSRCKRTVNHAVNGGLQGDFTQDGCYMTLEQALHGFESGFDHAQLGKLASLAHEVRFEEGDLIHLAGEKATAFYVLLSGSVSVELAADCCSVRIQALVPGDIFGWSSLLDNHETLFQVRAREHCTALCLNGSAISELCQQDSELGVKLLRRVLRTVAGRIHGIESQLALFCGLSKDGKHGQSISRTSLERPDADHNNAPRRYSSIVMPFNTSHQTD